MSDRPPSGACDCHLHANGDPARYPQSRERSFTAPYAPLPGYLSAADAAGLERLVIVQPSYYGTDNRCMLDAMAKLSSDRRRGVVSVDETVNAQELRRFHDFGVRGVRFNMIHGTRHSLEKIVAVADRIAPFGWHVQIYADGDNLPELASRLSGLPTEVVFDHMGGIKPERGINHVSVVALRRWLNSGRCWVKVMGLRASSAGYPFQDVAALARLLIGSSGDRCLWGSDWPHTNFTHKVPSLPELLAMLAGWAPAAAARHRILVENPVALYGFPAASKPDDPPAA